LCRCFFQINPEDGTKVGKKDNKGKQKKQVAVNPKVVTLLKNMNDFEWRLG
jgi:hypothetical protein